MILRAAVSACRIVFALALLVAVDAVDFGGRTVQAPIRDAGGQVYNVKAFGAKGDTIADDTVAIQAAINAIPVGSAGGGSVFLPAGGYRITAPILISGRTGAVLRGVGDGSRIYASASVPGMIRMADSNHCAVTDLYLKANSPVSLAMLHVTAAVSGERDNVERVFCEGNFQADVCFGVSLDYPNDTSEINFLLCWTTNAITAGWKGGNGVSGNVLDVRCYGCDSRHNLIGWWMHGCTATWQGGSTLGNAQSDFYLDVPVSYPVLIEGVRSEGSERFWMVGNGIGGPCPVTIRSVVVASYTGQYYLPFGNTFVINPGVVDGIVILHQSYLPITIEDFVARGQPAGQAINYKFNTAVGTAQT